MGETDSFSIKENETSAIEKSQQLLKEKNLENERLQQEVNLMQQVLDYLPFCVFWKDKQGVYLGNNNYTLETTKAYSCLREPEKIKHFRGKTDEEIFIREFAEIHRANDLEVLRTQKALEKESNITNPKEQQIIECDKKAPLFSNQGEVIGVMGYTSDITYLKSLESKVKNYGIAKIEFIRHMQHDIKTPFTGITGLTDILLDRETDSEKRDFLKDIILCTHELMEYCDRILDFSKATVKNLPLVPLTFQLRDIVDSVMNIAAPTAKIKQLHLSLDYVEPLPKTVTGYPHLLRSILVNLLNNALQYTQQGQIRLIVKSKTMSNNNSFIIQFIIEDTGQGMSSEKQIAIEKQLNDAPTVENDIYEGRGLGLRIVSQFAKDMGGKVYITSELGIGTAFTVETPLEITQV